MLKTILGWLFNSRPIKTTAKVGGGAIGGGALVLILMNYVNAKDQAVREYIDGQDALVKSKVIAVQVQLANVKKQVATSEGNILKAIEKLDSRIYKLATKGI